jgi:hypothetical protein
VPLFCSNLPDELMAIPPAVFLDMGYPLARQLSGNMMNRPVVGSILGGMLTVSCVRIAWLGGRAHVACAFGKMVWELKELLPLQSCSVGSAHRFRVAHACVGSAEWFCFRACRVESNTSARACV